MMTMNVRRDNGHGGRFLFAMEWARNHPLAADVLPSMVMVWSHRNSLRASAGGLQRSRAEDKGVPSRGTGGSNRRIEYGCVYPSPVASHRCADHVLGNDRRHRNTGFGP